MAHKLTLNNGYILGLDVGDKRIGVALASAIARLPQPDGAILSDSQTYTRLKDLIDQNDVKLVVVGVPRNLEGEETAQSRKIRSFAAELGKRIDVPIKFADESLSSNRADELAKSTSLKNVSQDSLAACFILEEFFGNMDSIGGET